MNRAFGVADDERHKNRRRQQRTTHSSKRSRRWTALKWSGVLAVTAFALALGLIQTASANPDHFAGDYFIFAKAAGDDPTTRTNSPNRTSRSATARTTSRPRSAAARASSTAASTATPTSRTRAPQHVRRDRLAEPRADLRRERQRPAPSPPDCMLQANNSRHAGTTRRRRTSPRAATSSWSRARTRSAPRVAGQPRRLPQRRRGDVRQRRGDVLPGASCKGGTSLTGTGTYKINAADHGAVICNETASSSSTRQTGDVSPSLQGHDDLARPIEINDSISRSRPRCTACWPGPTSDARTTRPRSCCPVRASTSPSGRSCSPRGAARTSPDPTRRRSASR